MSGGIALSGGTVWTFEQAGQTIDALAKAYADKGWGPGHRVALAVGNHPRHFFHFLALNQLGASIVPLNPDHRGSEIRHALTLSRADLVVAVPDRLDAVTDAVKDDDRLRRLPRVPVDGAWAINGLPAQAG